MMMPSIFGENLFDDFFDGFTKPFGNFNGYANQTNAMKTDVKEMEDSYELDIELPGVKKEDVKAELKDGYLTVSAAHGTKNDEKDENGKYIRKERYYGSASRSFYVGEQVKQEDVKAKFEDGILKLHVPKVQKQTEVEQKKYIQIEG
jgi:HSP20 family molecular chaperone IbpA